jgi:hypothetical protein
MASLLTVTNALAYFNTQLVVAKKALWDRFPVVQFSTIMSISPLAFIWVWFLNLPDPKTDSIKLFFIICIYNYITWPIFYKWKRISHKQSIR